MPLVLWLRYKPISDIPITVKLCHSPVETAPGAFLVIYPVAAEDGDKDTVACDLKIGGVPAVEVYIANFGAADLKQSGVGCGHGGGEG